MKKDTNKSLDLIQQIKKELSESGHKGMSAEFETEDGYRITVKVEKICLN